MRFDSFGWVSGVSLEFWGFRSRPRPPASRPHRDLPSLSVAHIPATAIADRHRDRHLRDQIATCHAYTDGTVPFRQFASGGNKKISRLVTSGWSVIFYPTVLCSCDVVFDIFELPLADQKKKS